MIVRIAQGHLNTKYGLFDEYLYYDGKKESIALTVGILEDQEEVLCRIHSHCISAHIFNSIECDCREQMEMAQQKVMEAGRGIIIWLDQEGRNNGHFALLQTSALRAQGVNQTDAYVQLGFSADDRSFTMASKILADLRIKSVSLMTNNPKKAEGLRSDGVPITKTVPIFIEVPDNPFLQSAYVDKRNRGHTIE